MCIEADGSPVAGAEVHFFQCVVGEPPRYKQFGPFTSDDRGRATCPRAVPYDGRGHYDRWAYARVPGRLVGIARSSNWKNYFPVNSEFRIGLEPSKSVDGQVTVPAGFDVTQVTVRVQALRAKGGIKLFPRYLPYAGLDTALPDVFEKHPDRAGRIRFDDVPDLGSLYLAAAGKGLAEAQWHDDFEAPIDLQLRREAIITGEVLLPDGKAAAGINVSAQLASTASGEIYHLTTFRAVSDKNGRFALHGLPEAPTILSVEDPRQEATMQPRENPPLAPDETVEIQLAMETGVLVSGTVTDAEGEAVEGASISAVSDGQTECVIARAMTYADGRYKFRLPHGSVRLYLNTLPAAYYPEFAMTRQLEVVAGQDAIEGVDFILGKRLMYGPARH